MTITMALNRPVVTRVQTYSKVTVTSLIVLTGDTLTPGSAITATPPWFVEFKLGEWMSVDVDGRQHYILRDEVGKTLHSLHHARSQRGTGRLYHDRAERPTGHQFSHQQNICSTVQTTENSLETYQVMIANAVAESVAEVTRNGDDPHADHDEARPCDLVVDMAAVYHWL